MSRSRGKLHPRNCEACGKAFFARGDLVKQGNGRFCSVQCSSRQAPLAERFAARVDPNGPVIDPGLGPCHVWLGQKNTRGYGVIRIEERQQKAHRVAFLLHHGRWPVPCALHKCDNTSCVNIEHLYEGTHQDNMRDAVERDLHRKPRGELSPISKLSSEDVREIRREYENGMSALVLANRFGVCEKHALRVARRSVRNEVA